MPNTLEALKSVIMAQGYQTGPVSLGGREAGKPFVTISRQTGAGGHTLAKMLKQALDQETREPLLEGWQLIDAELIKKLLENTQLHVSLDALASEEYHPPMEDMIYQLVAHRAPLETISHRAFALIRTLAESGKVIILGRAGACATATLPMGIHIRLVAPLSDRIQRIRQLLHVSESEAADTVAQQDKYRARLVRDFFGKDIDDPLLYHGVWNTHTPILESLVQWILQMIKTPAALR